MEKRAILAIVLSVIVLFGFQFLNTILYPQSEINETTNPNNNIVKITESDSVNNTGIESFIEDVSSENLVEEKISLKTDIFNVVFNTKGATISSIELNDYTVYVGESEKVDMVLQSVNDNDFFGMTLSDTTFDKIFTFNKIDDLTYEFSRKFELKNANGDRSAPIILVKRYTFLPDEYMFDLKISIQTDKNSIIPLNSNGSLYSLNVAKQIGPDFRNLDRREDYRRLSVFDDGKRRELKAKKNQLSYNEAFEWTAIEGKFFTLAVIPENSKPTLGYYTLKNNDKPTNELSLNRVNINSSYIEDSYKIYIGPKDKAILSKFNNSDSNGWKVSDFQLNKIIKFWPLGMFFMWVLELLNSVINNFGLSIIILTVLIKIVLYPFTRKSFDSMGKMQTIQPELKALQDKYKDDPTKLNKATSELYKKEGINPLGGCLPLLLQMPIFITFYTLFNEYIGLRGAAFIPGWINDLSKPEYILQFGFELPILHWDALRLLPVIYVATQLISMKFSQNNQSGGSSNSAAAMQTKMMTLGMPIMFFFIMYNQSSGLLLYWITQNVISSAQQIHSKQKSDKQHEQVLAEKTEKKLKKKQGRKK